MAATLVGVVMRFVGEVIVVLGLVAAMFLFIAPTMSRWSE
jgi:hypothetical protein